MDIHVNIRTIPEIAEAFKNRLDKKCSFKQWWKNNNPIIFFNDGKINLTVTLVIR